MASVEEYTDPHLKSYTYVPHASAGVCDVCHVVVDGGWQRCESCNLTTRQVSRPARLVVPISLYTWGGPLHHVLRNYKDGRTDAVRDPLGMRVSATLGRFVREHEKCLSGGDPFDRVTIVPSAKRSDPHPLESAVLRVRALGERFQRSLDVGPNPVSHRAASDRGFIVTTDVTGSRVLLVDDTFTSGAALQSAASALSLAGATDVVAVTVGRFFRPEYSASTKAFWDSVTDRDFSFDRCCLEDDASWAWPPPDPSATP